MTKYPPYVNSYGNIPNLFNAIKTSSVPPKFTQDFLSTMMGLKSSSYRAMIPLLKRLEFIDQGNVPTQLYKDYRDDSLSKTIMAETVRKAYADIFTAHEYAYKLPRQQLIGKVRTITGASAEDKVIPAVVGTFEELVKLADFDAPGIDKSSTIVEMPSEQTQSQNVQKSTDTQAMPRNLGISYTINLNLPATTEVEVFNAIFKSLKEHILND